MRYYFHLVSGRQIIADRQGVEVSDSETAYRLALEAINGICEEAGQIGEEWQGWRIDVVDPFGNVLLSVPLEPTWH
jgi:enamine deaminase RidA (YjgF/YER057c/UK114 family)